MLEYDQERTFKKFKCLCILTCFRGYLETEARWFLFAIPYGRYSDAVSSCGVRDVLSKNWTQPSFAACDVKPRRWVYFLSFSEHA
jgi:hypothetical protein